MKDHNSLKFSFDFNKFKNYQVRTKLQLITLYAPSGRPATAFIFQIPMISPACYLLITYRDNYVNRIKFDQVVRADGHFSVSYS